MTQSETSQADAPPAPEGFLASELFASLVVSGIYFAGFLALLFSYVVG